MTPFTIIVFFMTRLKVSETTFKHETKNTHNCNTNITFFWYHSPDWHVSYQLYIFADIWLAASDTTHRKSPFWDIVAEENL